MIMNANDDDQPRFQKFVNPRNHIGGKRARRNPENDCGDKVAMSRKAAMGMRDRGLRPYKCPFCGDWHVTGEFFSQSRK